MTLQKEPFAPLCLTKRLAYVIKSPLFDYQYPAGVITESTTATRCREDVE